MVTVYKTNVSTKIRAKSIVDKLTSELAGCRINFDLEDCDKILRIEGAGFNEGMVTEFLRRHKIQYEELL
ncbi:MAG: hypothetical protein PHS84_13275 [Paludibacter sp.]|jgi:hypothetical protein|nr:hypothetical protein [Paludibacter sp.]